MKIKICLAGATGWVGKELAKAIHQSNDFCLVTAVAKKSVGEKLGEIIGVQGLEVVISGTVNQALSTTCDILIDYTHPSVVKKHVEEAIIRKIPVVIGTSGLSEEDYDKINELALNHNVGVFAAGNFAITAVLLQHFAMLAAKHLPHWEIIDYAMSKKPDAPSGTAKELASKLSQVRISETHIPIEETIGFKESRGANVKGSQIHSVRLPCYVFGFEIIFGLPDQRLIMRHEGGSSAEPYVMGTLLAAKEVKSFVGLKRGLETIMKL